MGPPSQVPTYEPKSSHGPESGPLPYLGVFSCALLFRGSSIRMKIFFISVSLVFVSDERLCITSCSNYVNAIILFSISYECLWNAYQEALAGLWGYSCK